MGAPRSTETARGPRCTPCHPLYTTEEESGSPQLGDRQHARLHEVVVLADALLLVVARRLCLAVRTIGRPDHLGDERAAVREEVVEERVDAAGGGSGRISLGSNGLDAAERGEKRTHMRPETVPKSHVTR